MIDLDIDNVREEIKDLPYEDKLAFLEDKESELDDIVEELNGYISDISSLKDEIQTKKNDKMCQQILQSLKDNGYSIELDSNGNLTFPLGLANITIIMQFLNAKVEFYFKESQSQLQIRELISSILPEFKADGNHYSQKVPEEDICKCVVDVVDKLMGHRLEFERFMDK